MIEGREANRSDMTTDAGGEGIGIGVTVGDCSGVTGAERVEADMGRTDVGVTVGDCNGVTGKEEAVDGCWVAGRRRSRVRGDWGTFVDRANDVGPGDNAWGGDATLASTCTSSTWTL